jgi:hypothetical protein
MIIGIVEIKLEINYARSLKEKRMVLKSILAKTRSKFNISVAETAEQDRIQTAIITYACVAANTALADSITEKVIRFVENNTDARVSVLRKENILC